MGRQTGRLTVISSQVAGRMPNSQEGITAVTGIVGFDVWGCQSVSSLFLPLSVSSTDTEKQFFATFYDNREKLVKRVTNGLFKRICTDL